MTKTFKCLTAELPSLRKKINHITKKLDKYSLKWTFEIISEQPEKITIYDYTGQSHLAASEQRPKITSVVYDVTSYKFEMESIKIGNYTVLAVIDHGEDNNNIVHIVNEVEGINALENYKNCKSKCDHCNHNRYRSKTVILYDGNNIVQVGKSCLKEYIGIDCYDIIKCYQDIKSITLTDIVINDLSTLPKDKNYKFTVDYLAFCINSIQQEGYIKDHTKYKAWKEMNKELEISNELYDVANTVIKWFTENEFNDLFLNNIKNTLQQTYTKPNNGFIAYAYMAYQKELKHQKEQQEKEESQKLSKFVGSINDKIELAVTLDDWFTFEGLYGYQQVFIMKDDQDNIFKWVTNKPLWKDIDKGTCYEIGESFKIKGTIKEHDNSKGYNQTVLTRCKLV